jgi:hypothetical protein
MSNDRSREGLIQFLDYLADKGLMARNTAMARKAATNKVLGVLSGEEALDVTKIDFDDIMRRFQNLEGRNYTPTSLTTYQSRIKSALVDFETYLKNPLGFRPNVQARERSSNSKATNASVPKVESSQKQPQSSMHAQAVTGAVLPIPIRSDLTVYIQGLPFDLTEAEARKISNVVLAYGTSK